MLILCGGNAVKYYKICDLNNKLVAIGTGNGGIEITESEYNTLLSEIREKATLVDQLYNGEIAISDVPTEWQEEIQRRVDERIEMQGAIEKQEISPDEFYTMVEGVL